MNDYDLLGLMDTHKAMKQQGIQGVPDDFFEFLTGIEPVETNDERDVQIGQGTRGYEEGIRDVEQRDKTADYVTNKLGLGESRTGLKHLDQFIPGSTRPYPEHREAMEHKKRLDTRREIGYDK